MADRRRQTILLLGSRYDGLYLPPGSLVTPAGLVPSEREPCAACGGVLLRDDFGKEIRRKKGRGWIKDRFQRKQPCTACGGGFVDGKLEPGAGWIARDPMDAQQVRVGSSTTTATARPVRTVQCDSCGGDGVKRGKRCMICDGEGRRPLHIFELHVDDRDTTDVDPLDAAIDARNESGSYAELERALVGVAKHINKPARYRWLTDNAINAIRLLDEVYLPPAERDETQLDPDERALLDLAVDYLVWRMPDPIVVPPGVAANQKILAEHRTRAHGRGPGQMATRQRDAEIRRHAQDRRSPQWIASEYGLSISTVYSIVNRVRT